MTPDHPQDHPQVRRVSNADEAGRLVADLLTHAADRAVAERGRFTLAIPGGSSPKAVFDHLAAPDLAHPFPWAHTHLFWVDERAVPLDHPDSNAGAFSRDVLPRLPLTPDRVHRMRGELGPHEGARDYHRTLSDLLGSPPLTLDAALLGVGEDGHVASLFPGAPTLRAQEPVLGITDSPKPPPERITLSMPVLLGARTLVLLGLGAAKADAVARALAGEPLPANLAARNPGAVWVVDAAATPASR